MDRSGNRLNGAAGFSLVELMIAMTVTLVIAGLASTLIAQSFNARSRENRRTAALAGAQRALNIMSRQIANAGFGLNPGVTNGIVAADSNNPQIRIRADLNGDGAVNNMVQGESEDVAFMVSNGGGRNSLVSFSAVAGASSVLSDRIDRLRVRYYAQRVNYTAVNNPNDANSCDIQTAGGVAEVNPAQARYVVLVVCADLPPVGAPRQPGFQPRERVQLVSDVALRNSALRDY